MDDREPSGRGRDDEQLWRTLADRANRLLASRGERDGRRYSDKDFARLILEETGESVSHTQIWKLRNKKLTNPTIKFVEILACFTGAPVKYFLDPDEQAARRVEAELELLAELKEAGIPSIAAQGAGLSALAVARPADGVSAETIKAITAMVRDFRDTRKAQGLDGAEPGPAPPPVEG